MHSDVPQWLVQAFVRSAQAAGSTESKEQLAAVCHSLIEAWSSNDRKYHGLHHVVELLTRVETLLPETGDPALVRLAAWFHGVCFSTSEEATYRNNGGENEEASALFAEAKLYELGVDPDKARRVATLIRSLRVKPTASPTETSRFQAIDIDEQALRDAHLGTLAVEPQKYKRYLELVREEYEHIPREDFLRARRAIITKLLSRRQLFVTPLARQWDESARENLAAELQRLNEVLPECDATTHPASGVPEHQSSQTDRLGEADRLGQVDRATQPPREQAKPLSEGTSAKPNAIDSLLNASQDEEAAERAAAEKEAARLAQLQSETASQLSRKDTLSSLESCADKFDPGVRESAALTPEQKRQRRREQIAAQMRQRIEERHRAADTARMERVHEAERAAQSEATRATATPNTPSTEHTGAAHAAETKLPSLTPDAPHGSPTKPAGTETSAIANPSEGIQPSEGVKPSESVKPSEEARSSDQFRRDPIAVPPTAAEQPAPDRRPGVEQAHPEHGPSATSPASPDRRPLPPHSKKPDGTPVTPASAVESPQRVSIWERLSDSPLSANTPEWIDDDPSDYHDTHVPTDDLVRGIPHFTDDDDVKATGILNVPTHGIEKEPDL